MQIISDLPSEYPKNRSSARFELGIFNPNYKGILITKIKALVTRVNFFNISNFKVRATTPEKRDNLWQKNF